MGEGVPLVRLITETKPVSGFEQLHRHLFEQLHRHLMIMVSFGLKVPHNHILMVEALVLRPQFREWLDEKSTLGLDL